MVVMGRVGAPHGVRGEVRVQPLSSASSTLLEPQRWWLRRPEEVDSWRRCDLAGARLQGRLVVARIDEATTRDAAAALRGAEIGIARADLPAPGLGEWYRHDLIGLSVVTREGVLLGTVRGFTDSPAHPLLEVAMGRGGIALIPWVARHVLAVDSVAGKIEVDWQQDD